MLFPGVDDCKLKQYLAWVNKPQAVSGEGALHLEGRGRPAEQGKRHQRARQQQQHRMAVQGKQTAAPRASKGCQLQAVMGKGVTTRAAAATAAAAVSLTAPSQQGRATRAALNRTQRALAA
jgi:hypothetical protein